MNVPLWLLEIILGAQRTTAPNSRVQGLCDDAGSGAAAGWGDCQKTDVDALLPSSGSSG